MRIYSNIQFHLPIGGLLRKIKAEKNSRNILLICDDLMGDLLMMSGIVKVLHERGYIPTLIVRDTWKDLATFMWADEVLPVNINLYRQSLRYRINFLNEVRKKSYLWATASLFLSGVSANILRYCGASRRYAFCRGGGN